MASARPPCKQAGFTLIEALAALAVASIVLLSTAALLRSLAFTFDRGVHRVDRAEQLLRAVERLSSDLAGAAHITLSGPAGATLLFFGSRNRLLFVTRSGSGTGPLTDEAVALDVETSDGVSRLVRRRTVWVGARLPLQETTFGSPVVLLEGQVEISFRFGQIDSKGALAWTDSWLDVAKLPRLVQMAVRESGSGADLLPGTMFSLRTDAPAGCAAAEADLKCLSPETAPASGQRTAR